MKTLVVLISVLFLAGCPRDEPPPDTGLAGYDPHLIDNQRAACDASGGRFGQGGAAGTFVCYQNTRDANKSCTRKSQCEGLCLARSGTCAPVTPFFGCHEVFGNSGGRSTVCTN